MSLPNLSILKFDDTLGAMLVGLIVSTGLFGLTTLQTYMYYVDYHKDRATYKWLVGIVWLLDFIHTILISHSAYYFLVQQYGKPFSLLQGEWSIIVEVTVTVMVTVLVQCFLAYRVYRLSRGNWVIAGLIIILAFTHTALGIASTIKLFQIQLFILLPDILGVLSATLIIMAVNDVLITVTLCWYLRKTQHTSGTHDAVSLLIVYTIETGLVTSVFVTVDAICLLKMPRNWVFIGIEFCLSKLYANSLLTILNSRRSVRKKFTDVLPTPSSGTSRPSVPRTSIAIQRVQVTTQVTHDEGDGYELDDDAFILESRTQGSSTVMQPQKYSYTEDSPQQITFHDRYPPTHLSSSQDNTV